MHKGRLEAFSDAVIAIIMTIMVLELKVPHGGSLEDLVPLWPVFLSYLLSYIYLAIYWNNHHHMLQISKSVRGGVLWANMHLLFWLSLVPFTTAWMGENQFTAWSVTAYGVVLLGSAIAYYILSQCLIGVNGTDSPLARAVGRDFKGKISIGVYAVALPSVLISPWIPCALYALVAAMWLTPDRRIERHVEG